MRYSSDPGRDWQGMATGGVDVYLTDVSGDVMTAEPHARKLAMQISHHFRASEDCRQNYPFDSARMA